MKELNTKVEINGNELNIHDNFYMLCIIPDGAAKVP